MSRPIGTADELERRRKRAVQAVADGEPRKTVAKVFGVHYKTVARWVRAARLPGGLDAKPQPAPTPGLTDADLRRLEGLLAKGAKAHGWHSQLWTAARVARLIEREFGISYHPENTQPDCPSRRRWVGTRRIGYHRRDGVDRAGRVVPATPRGNRRRSRMSDTIRRPAPPRA